MNNIVDLLSNNRIHIPMIQRDYAYGRKSEEKKVNNFLEEIFKVLINENDELRLNYIYGVPDTIKDNDGNDVDVVVLIDGQQRVTTLYLMKLFFCVNADENVSSFSKQLSYATRTTSKDFCEFLNENSSVLKIEEGKNLNEKLENNTAFFKKWRNDPTVFSMIRVLEKINTKCKGLTSEDIKNANNRFDRITFEFIRLEGFKRGEALYSTMNGRGKQLTEFEKIKSKVFDILKEYEPHIEHIVNEQWIPSFWEYALEAKKEISNDKDEQYMFASVNHDDFLYRFFRYILTMLWCENNTVYKNDEKEKTETEPESEAETKGKKYYEPAPIEDVLEWIKNSDTDLRKNTCELILFAMHSFSEWENLNFEDYFADGYVSRHNDIELINSTLKPKQGFKLISQCCESEEFSNIDMLSQSLLWAFIIFKWNERQDNLNRKSLTDYFVLMLDIYAASWDSNTPTSTEKKPEEYLVLKGIMAFRQIINGSIIDKKYEEQKNTFESKNEVKYQILNNYCTRRCSNNIAKLIRQEGYSREQAKQFAGNIDYLIQHYDGIENIVALEKNDIKPYFICQSNNMGRLYLPCTKKMLQSLFSMGNWASNDWYQNFLHDLSTKPLNSGEDRYTVDDWQWYVKIYKDCFVYESSYGAFDFEKDSLNEQPKFFEMNGVYGMKATKKQNTSPFVLAAYKKIKYPNNKVDKNMITECQKLIEDKKIVIKQDSNGVKVSSSNESIEKVWGDEKDFVECICEIIKNL